MFFKGRGEELASYGLDVPECVRVQGVEGEKKNLSAQCQHAWHPVNSLC